MAVPSDRAREVFAEAMRQPAEQRAAFIERACAGDGTLLAGVESLISGMDEAAAAESLQLTSDASSRSSAPTVFSARGPAGPSEGPGSVIGPYKILELIGEGGFGSVFMAEQEKPVRRRVALKVIKLGMDTRQVVARFEQERQALAMMDHANIAKVLEAGATETGRPFFVMEFVQGDPITLYCDRNSLSIVERLRLFAQVCNAVQHAHQKGIIHRDIKPSNVLVSTQDGKPLVKVIDFGIAKATGARLTEMTLFTEHKTFIGTPEYMSPEQAEGSLDIDTRTDVYSLGVLLYELLTGATPFDGRELRSAAYGEMQRIIREVDPPKPSTRVSLGRDTIAKVAASRRLEPSSLGSTVRGELDWIVMKALEKDRRRRYETANGLAMDIQRYLNGEAVVAAPPSSAYRFRKFVRRHKGIALSGAAGAAALLIGLVGFAWQARVARDQRDRALAAEAETARRAAQLKQVADFQARMLGQIDPTEAGRELSRDVLARYTAALAAASVPERERAGLVEAFERQWGRVNATDTARELIEHTILEPAIETIDEEFEEQPAVDAQLRQTLAFLYQQLGLFDAALPLQTAALATNRRVLGEEHPDTLSSINNTGMLLRDRGELDEADPYLQEALDKRRRVLGEEHPDTLTSINNMGFLRDDQGRLDEAETFYREALEKHRRVLGEDHPETLVCIDNLAMLLKAQDKLTEAGPYFRESVEKSRRVRGEDAPDTLIAINNMGLFLQAEGKLAEAEPYFRESLEKRRRVLGEEHPSTLSSINNMGFLLEASGRLTEAEPYFRESLEKHRRVLGEEHPNTLSAINNMGMLLRAQGKLAEAEPYARDVLERLRAVLGEEHPNTVSATINLGSLLEMQGKLDEAEPYLRRALETGERVFGDDHQVTLNAMSWLGTLRVDQGRLAEAEPYRREVLETRRRVLGEDHPDTLLAVISMGELRVRQGQSAEAIALLAPIEGAAREKFTAGNARNLARLLCNLGTARAARATGPADFALAERNLLEAHATYLTVPGTPPKEIRRCDEAIVGLYAAWDKAEPNKGYAARGAEWRSRSNGS
ncbi:MAG: tetratricopeptide repeat protein [Acidobacteria bacterium]|nr:tetratricopeptide repeat protein [Acidobacteriota bacterium]